MRHRGPLGRGAPVAYPQGLQPQQQPVTGTTRESLGQHLPRSFYEFHQMHSAGGVRQQPTSLPLMPPTTGQLPYAASPFFGVADPYRRQTPAQMSSEVTRTANQLVPRVFAVLPQDVYCEAYGESILLMCEDWPFYDAMRLCAGLRVYFTNIPGQHRPPKKPNPKETKEAKEPDEHKGESEGALQYRYRQELREWSGPHGRLPHVINRVFRTFQLFQGEFPYACREVDVELRALDQKRCIIMYGRAKANEIQHRIRSMESHVPNWVKARDTALGGFRSGSTYHDATTNPNPPSVDPYATY